MKVTKRRIAAALIAPSLLLAAACSSDGGDAETGTVIRLSAWYEESLMAEPLAAVNSQLEGQDITVEYIYIPHDQYDTWLSTQLASGEGPDIVADGANFPARVRAGNLIPVTDNPVLENYNEAGLTLSTDEAGEVYGIPAYGWFSGIFYNVDLFEQLGLDVPTTFDEFLEVSAAFTAEGITPLTLGLSDGDTAWHSLTGYLENSFYNNGSGDPQIDFDVAYGQQTITGTWDEPVADWYRIIEEGVINERMLGLSSDQAIIEFGAGEAAMTISGPWNYDKIKDTGVNFAMFSHVGNDPDNLWLVGGPAANFGVNADSTNQDAALQVFEALASEEAQLAFLEANAGAFSYYDGVEIEIPSEYDLVADILSQGNVGTVMDRWGVNMPAQSMVDTAIKQLQVLISGDITPQEFVEAMNQHADSVRY